MDNDILSFTANEEKCSEITKIFSQATDECIKYIEDYSDLPYVGTVLKLGKSITGIWKARYFEKLALFIKKCETIPKDEIQNFINGIDKDDRKKIAEYLSSVLLQCYDGRKAELLAYVYEWRVKNGEDYMDDEYKEDLTLTMLRLIHIIDKVFVDDLKGLDGSAFSYSCEGLISVGLVQQKNFAVDKGSLDLDVEFEHSYSGKVLYHILEKNNWFDPPQNTLL